MKLAVQPRVQAFSNSCPCHGGLWNRVRLDQKLSNACPPWCISTMWSQFLKFLQSTQEMPPAREWVFQTQTHGTLHMETLAVARIFWWMWSPGFIWCMMRDVKGTWLPTSSTISRIYLSMGGFVMRPQCSLALLLCGVVGTVLYNPCQLYHRPGMFRHGLH